MEFYFDIDFFYLLTDQKLSEEVFDDFFKRFLARLNNSKVFFVAKDIQEVDLTIPNIFIQRILSHSNAVPEVISLATVNEIISNADTIGFKFFFLNDALVTDSIIRDYGFIAINPITLNNIWSIIDSGRDNKRKYFSKEKGENLISNWSELNKYILPINSLIITDRYLFSSEEDVECNLVEILKNIGLKKLGKRKVDILIIGNEFFDYYKKRRGNRFYTGNVEFEQAFQKVKLILGNIFDSSEDYNFTLLRTDEKTIPAEREIHFRTLLSNGIFINPGHSFTILNRKGPKVGEYITIDYFLNSEIRNVNIEPLKLLKKALSKIVNEPEIIKVHFHNEKKCQILNDYK